MNRSEFIELTLADKGYVGKTVLVKRDAIFLIRPFGDFSAVHLNGLEYSLNVIENSDQILDGLK